MKVQFKSLERGVRNAYIKSSDEHHFSEEEISEILTYKNISEDFEYNDWFGDSTMVKATLVGVERTKSKDLVFTIQMNKDIPEHYVPTPSEILKGKGLLFPISVHQI